MLESWRMRLRRARLFDYFYNLRIAYLPSSLHAARSIS